ncbi:hypothetical protein CTAYLR_006990 [Chrysophaeum taylorii]|uniref:Uncharacterized protein n=1 Tax=Chrysophaeum taylorii TaxID=2483200 RepID=A0AAD7UAJ4_9STRA|nr:hypothetical protein CTAYLR_006990 [Chrysophaeum taylorii]
MRILGPDEPVTGARLRGLSKAERRLARIEMAWDRDEATWAASARRVQRVWRGRRIRQFVAVRAAARAKRRFAIAKVREGLGRKDLEAIDEAIAADTRCGEALLAKSSVLFATDARQAARAATAALRLLPDDPRGLLLRARCRAQLGVFEAAVDDLSSILDQSEEEASGGDVVRVGDDNLVAATVFLRAAARVRLGDWKGAEADFRRYLELTPSTARRDPRRARALDFVGVSAAANDDFNAGVDALTDAAVQDPRPPRLCLLARLHACERQWQLAEDRYKDALLLDPDCGMARVGLAQTTIPHEPLPLVSGL